MSFLPKVLFMVQDLIEDTTSCLVIMIPWTLLDHEAFLDFPGFDNLDSFENQSGILLNVS